ncbi:GNAT family N-acetyltransferase [Cytobacillus sp. S13-E01]|uniref:GNAT family N-acetyltransferase n=1 Tax=Cytobacillus sp. S13-E01 TaxID=3031326 RepID=UPI0023D7D2EB|nr:GNAT family N-acetyltransferase [Cytobacillus sp. S13-E01]MDF0727056.1 GNAT family N-acetyltransferase [Cytobacillus sp. S13-E01]
MDLENRKIEVRLISVEDLVENKIFLINLLEDNLKINFPNMSNLTEYAINGYDDMLRFKKDNSAILIGAFDKEKIIGFLWAYTREILSERRIHIGHIVVNSEVRSGGIGSKLLKCLEDYSIRVNIKKIDLMTTLENEKTMKFYKENGYSIVRVQLEKELGDIDDN